MPARGDLNPSDVRGLLPNITLIDRVDGKFHYRLVGTAISEEMGRDLTGSFVGSYVTPPEYATAICGIYEQVFATARPIFTTGEYKPASGLIHNVSRLMLPLSTDGATADMVVLTRIGRVNHYLAAGADWLKGAPGKVCDIIEVTSADHAEALCIEWERQCLTATAG